MRATLSINCGVEPSRGGSIKITSARSPAAAASPIHRVASAAKKRAFFTPLCFALPIDVYKRQDKGTGLLRHCLLRRGVMTGQVMVVLVTAQPVLPGAKNFVKALLLSLIHI